MGIFRVFQQTETVTEFKDLSETSFINLWFRNRKLFSKVYKDKDLTSQFLLSLHNLRTCKYLLQSRRTRRTGAEGIESLVWLVGFGRVICEGERGNETLQLRGGVKGGGVVFRFSFKQSRKLIQGPYSICGEEWW